MKKQLTFLSGILAFMALVAFTPVSDSDGFYRVDLDASKVNWVASKITGSTHEGFVKVMEGGIQISNGEISGGKFTIDMTSITVTDLDGGMKEKLEGHLKNDDFFAVDKFKTASLAIVSVNDNKVKANLTIKGITHEVEFPVEMNFDDNGGLKATASIEVDRAKYDVKYKSGSFFENLGDKAINDIIKFDVVIVGKAG
ncbi:MAG: YceI family protein [Flavobacteriales bacterium]|nr:YceI family protein [Flavobacteriales bacterium]